MASWAQGEGIAVAQFSLSSKTAVSLPPTVAPGRRRRQCLAEREVLVPRHWGATLKHTMPTTSEGWTRPAQRAIRAQATAPQ